MAGSIGSLTGNLTLESAAFIRDLGKAASAVNANTAKMARSFQGVEKSLTGVSHLLKAYLSFEGIRRVAEFSATIVENAAALHDQAAAVGVTASTLQTYRLAGKEAGVATEQLDRSMGIFVRTVGQAKVGMGPLTDGLKTTNAALLEQVKGASTTAEALDIMLDAIKQAPNDFERARLSQLAFGRGGLAMARLAVESSAEARKAYAALGIVIRDDVTDKADEMVDSFDRVKTAFMAGVTNSFIDQLNTSLLMTNDRLKGAADLGALVGSGLGKAVQEIIGWIDQLLAKLDQIQKLWNDINNSTVGRALSDALNALTLGANDASAALNALPEDKVLVFGRRPDLQNPTLPISVQESTDKINAFNAAIAAVDEQKVNLVFGRLPHLQTISQPAVPLMPDKTPEPVFPKGETSFPKPQGAEPVFPVPEVVNASTEAINQNAASLGNWSTHAVDALGRSLDLDDMLKEGTHVYASLQTPMEEYASSLQRISDLQRVGAITAETAQRATQQAVLQTAGTYVDAASQITSTLAGAFENNKAFAIANAVMNVAEGITQALKLPFPLNWAQVAAVTAAGIVQIKTITSAKPGKSQAISSGKSAGATSASSAGSSGRTRAAGPSQVVTLNIVGDVFGPEHFRKIIAGINSAQRDGTPLIQMQGA